MKLCGALVLVLTMSTVCGLRCYSCTLSEPNSCTDTTSCPVLFDRCFSTTAESLNVVTKGCQTSTLCVGPIQCCEGDLCNNAALAGPSFIVLLVSLAVVKHFL